jgi:hypothetical protein
MSNFFRQIIEPELPKAICPKCGKEYITASINQQYAPHVNEMCYSCWKSQLQGRKLTRDEIQEAAESFIEEKSKFGFYDCSLPDFYSKEQEEAILRRVGEIYAEREATKEAETRATYLKKAEKFIEENGNDLENIVAALLRLIDDNYTRLDRKVPLSEMRFG